MSEYVDLNYKNEVRNEGRFEREFTPIPNSNAKVLLFLIPIATITIFIMWLQKTKFPIILMWLGISSMFAYIINFAYYYYSYVVECKETFTPTSGDAHVIEEKTKSMSFGYEPYFWELLLVLLTVGMIVAQTQSKKEKSIGKRILVTISIIFYGFMFFYVPVFLPSEENTKATFERIKQETSVAVHQQIE